MTKFEAVARVSEELARATKRFGPFVSAHEGLAIIREEYLEFEKEVFWGTRKKQMVEATQLAAMSLRFLIDCVGEYPVVESDDGTAWSREQIGKARARLNDSPYDASKRRGFGQ